MRGTLGLGLAVAALLASGPAGAANLLSNGGFEARPTTGLNYGTGVPGGHVQNYPQPPVTAQYLPGWIIGDPSVSDLYHAPVTYPLVPAAAAEGLQFMSLNWSPLGGVTLDNTISQAFVLGAGAMGIQVSSAMSVESGYPGSTLQFDILSGATLVAQSPQFTHLLGNGAWSQKTWSTALSPGAYTLRLHGVGSGNAWDVLVDDVMLQSVSAPAPEPSAWMLMILGCGLAGVALRRRALAAT